MHRPAAVLFLACLAVLMSGSVVSACPMCQEAVPNSTSAEDEDATRLALAYNRSIYLMVAIPYLMLGTVGFMVYRHLRVRAALEATQRQPAQPHSPGEPVPSQPGARACSLPSPVEDS